MKMTNWKYLHEIQIISSIINETKRKFTAMQSNWHNMKNGTNFEKTLKLKKCIYIWITFIFTSFKILSNLWSDKIWEGRGEQLRISWSSDYCNLTCTTARSTKCQLKVLREKNRYNCTLRINNTTHIYAASRHMSSISRRIYRVYHSHLVYISLWLINRAIRKYYTTIEYWM